MIKTYLKLKSGITEQNTENHSKHNKDKFPSITKYLTSKLKKLF